MNKSKDKLWQLCSDYIKQYKISCPETIYQCDRVIFSATEFIENVANIVGYHKYDKEDI